MKSSALPGKIVVVTGMRRIPSACIKCTFYDNMGNKSRRRNDGVCGARGYFYTTRNINVTKERLPTCPLVKVESEKYRKDNET